MSDTIKAADGGQLLNAEQFNYTKNELGQPVLNVVGGGGGDSGVTTLHIYVSAIDKETAAPTFTADKTPTEMQPVVTPTWCVITFAAGTLTEGEASFGVPPVWGGGAPCFGYMYIPSTNENKIFVSGNIDNNEWTIDLTFLDA